MKNTAQKLILASFILALVAAITVFFYLQSLKSPNESTSKTTVLVASETIYSGTVIDKKMIKEIKISDDSILGDYIIDSSMIVGKYAKETIFENEGFHTDKLLDKDGNELNVKIDSNNRAMAISVTGDSGVADLLKPGDYVDIITYVAEKRDGAKVVRPDMAKIILQNIELLAVDKQLKREDKANEKISDEEKTLTNFLVTLSVPTSEIEKLVLAQSVGTIKLALRPLKENNITETKGTTWEELDINVSGTSEGAVGKENNESNINKEYISYTIKAGDTLKNLSIQYYGDKDKYTIIKEANNIQDENLILIGEVIKIPILQ